MSIRRLAASERGGTEGGDTMHAADILGGVVDGWLGAGGPYNSLDPGILLLLLVGSWCCAEVITVNETKFLSRPKVWL